MGKLDFSIDKIENTDNKKDSIDNLQDAQSYTSLKGLQDLFKYIYPVNSIYISFSHTNPANLFGGTWERMSQTFLWGTGEECTIGAQGGKMAHTLSVDEMPAHRHSLPMLGVSGSTTQSTEVDTVQCANWTNVYAYRGNVVQTAGGSKQFEIMPPFTNVSIWRRTEL